MKLKYHLCIKLGSRNFNEVKVFLDFQWELGKTYRGNCEFGNFASLVFPVKCSWNLVFLVLHVYRFVRDLLITLQGLNITLFRFQSNFNRTTR